MIKSERDYKEVQDYFKNSFYIPNDWDYLQFSNVVLINPKTEIPTKRAFYIPMDAVNIEAGSVDYIEERNVRENGSLPKFQKNDILFARITPSTENGKVCIIKDCDYGIASSELIVLRPTNKVLPRYLFYFVKSDRIKKFAISQMMGTTGRQRVPDNVFKKYLRFELPPLEEQQKIVSILSNVDKLMQKIEQIIAQTQRLKKGLIKKLLLQGIGHPRHKPVRFGPCFLNYKIPEEWEVLTLDKCVLSDTPITYGIVQAGSHVPDGVPYIRTGDMSGDKLSIENMLRTSREIASLFVRSRVKAGEIVCALRGIVGKVLEVPKVLEGANLTQGTARISPRHDIYSRYLLWALQSEYARKQFEIFSKGTTLNEITLERLRKIKVAIPADINEQKRIAQILDQLELAMGLQSKYKEKIVKLKLGLMQQLLTGKIRVKV